MANKIQCEFCGIVQESPVEIFACVKCGAPLKPQEKVGTLEKLCLPVLSVASGEVYCEHLLDASHWQGDIDWQKYDGTDSRYIILKAGQGDFYDATFNERANACLQDNIPFGLYHLLDTRYDIEAAAIKFATQFNSIPAKSVDKFSRQTDFCRVRPFLDVELNNGNDARVMRNKITDFDTVFFNHTGVKLGYYTRASFWDYAVAPIDWVHERALWVAHYNTYIARPLVPQDWARYGKREMIWQYSADGNGEGDDYGMQSNSVDKNKTPGTCEEFHENFINVEPVDPPPPPEDVCTWVFQALVNVNYRKLPVVSASTYVGTFTAGTLIDAHRVVAPAGGQVWLQFKGNDGVDYYSVFMYNDSIYWKQID